MDRNEYIRLITEYLDRLPGDRLRLVLVFVMNFCPSADDQ